MRLRVGRRGMIGCARYQPSCDHNVFGSFRVDCGEGLGRRRCDPGGCADARRCGPVSGVWCADAESAQLPWPDARGSADGRSAGRCCGEAAAPGVPGARRRRLRSQAAAPLRHGDHRCRDRRADRRAARPHHRDAGRMAARTPPTEQEAPGHRPGASSFCRSVLPFGTWWRAVVRRGRRGSRRSAGRSRGVCPPGRNGRCPGREVRRPAGRAGRRGRRARGRRSRCGPR